MNTRPVGRAYEVVCDFAEKYRRKPLFYLPDLMSELKQAGNDEYRADKEFPPRLYGMLSDCLIKALLSGMKDFSGDDIKNTYLSVWKFHRKYLLMERTDETIDQAVTEAGAMLKEERKESILTQMYYAAIKDVADRVAEAEKASGQTAKEQAS